MRARILFYLILGSGLAWGGEDLSEEAGKYLEVLRARPESQGLFERFTDSWKEERDGVELLAFLEKEAEASGEAKDWAILARAEESAGKDEEALVHFGKALEAMPEAAWMRVARAKLLWRKRQFSEAADEVLKVPVGHDLRIEAAGLAGRAMIRSQRQDEAIRLWLEEVKRSPEDTDLLEDLVELCRKEGQTAQALDFSDKLLEAEKDPLKREQARLDRMSLLFGQGQTDRAMDAASDVLNASGSGSWLEREVLDRAEQGLKQRGGFATWMKQLGEWSRAFPSRLELSKRHVEALANAGEWDAALDVVKGWLRRSPGDAAGLRVRIRLLEGAGRNGAAWKALEDLADRFPDDEALLKEQVEMAYRFERKDDLRAALEKWSAAAKDDAARVRTGETWARYGFRKEAEELWMGLIDGDAGAMADRALAAFHRQEKRFEDEKKDWGRLGRRGDPSSREAAANGLIAARAADLALELFEGVVVETSADAALLTRIAKATGDQELAYRHARAWLALAERVVDIERAVDSVIRLADALEEEESLLAELDAKVELKAEERCLLAELLAKKTPERVGEILKGGGKGDQDLLHEYHVGFLTRATRWVEAAQRFAEVKPRLGREAFYYHRLGDLYRGGGNNAAATEAYRKWRDAAPDDVEAWKAEAAIWSRIDPRRSERLLRRALARFEEPAGLDEMLLSVLKQGRDQRGAFELSWKSYLRDQSNPRWSREIIATARQSQRLEELAELLEKLADDQATSPLPMLALADLVVTGSWRNSGRTQAEFLNEALRRAPGEKRVWIQLARLEESQGNGGTAIQAWEEIAQRWPGPQTAKDLAIARLRNGDIERGLREWSELASGDGVDIRRCEEAALGVAMAGHLAEATAFLEGLGETNDLMSRWVLSNLLRWDGREEEEIEILAALVEDTGGQMYPQHVNAQAAGYGELSMLVSHVSSLRWEEALALPDPVKYGARNLLSNATTDKSIGTAAAQRLFQLGLHMGGKAWMMAETAMPELKISHREEWAQIVGAWSTGRLVELWRSKPESEIFGISMMFAGKLGVLTAEERTRLIESRKSKLPPAEELEFRISYLAGVDSEWVVGWMEGLKPGTLEASSVERAIRRVNWARDVELATRCDRVFDHLVTGDDRSRIEFLGIRADLAIAMGDVDLAIPRIKALLNRWEEMHGDDERTGEVFSSRNYHSYGSGRYGGGFSIASFLESTRGLEGIERYSYLRFDLAGQPEFASAMDSPVIRCQSMLMSPEFEKFLEKERKDLAADGRDDVRGDLEILECVHAVLGGRLDSLQEQIDEAIRENPKSRLAEFGVAARLSDLAKNGMKSLDQMESLLASARDKGVDLDERAMGRALMSMASDWYTHFHQGRSTSIHGPAVSLVDPEHPLLGEIIVKIYSPIFGNLNRGYGISRLFAATKGYGNRTPLQLLRPQSFDNRLFNEHLKAERLDEAVRSLVDHYARWYVGDSSMRHSIGRLVTASGDPAALLAGVPPPVPADGLSACRKWIQFAGLCGQHEQATRLVKEVAELRSWDMGWQVEWLVQGCRLEEPDLPELPALVERPTEFQALMNRRIGSRPNIPKEALISLSRELIEGIPAGPKEIWLVPILQKLVARVSNEKEDAGALGVVIWEVAARVANEDVQIDRIFAELESTKLAAQSERMLAFARRCWLGAARAENLSEYNRNQRIAGRPQLWMIRQLADQPMAEVFPPDFLSELKASDERSAIWLERLLGAGNCSELPAPFKQNGNLAEAEDQGTLLEVLSGDGENKDSGINQMSQYVRSAPLALVMARAEQLPGKRVLYDALVRARGIGLNLPKPAVRFESKALIEAMESDPANLEKWIASALEVIEEQEKARAEAVIGTPPYLASSPKNKIGIWISSLTNQLLDRPEVWARVVRLAVQREIVLISLQIPPVPDDWSIDKPGLSWGFDELVEIGCWQQGKRPEQDFGLVAVPDEGNEKVLPISYLWKGKEFFDSRRSRFSRMKRDERDEFVEMVRQKERRSFGESLLLMSYTSQSDRNRFNWLSEYDKAFAALDRSMAIGVLEKLLGDHKADYYEGLGPNVGEILNERDAILHDEAGEVMARAIKLMGSDKPNDRQIAARILSSTKHRKWNPEAWLDAMEFFAGMDPAVRMAMMNRFESVLREAWSGLDAENVRRLFRLMEEVPSLATIRYSRQWMPVFWRSVLSDDELDRVGFRAIAKVVDNHAPPAFRDQLWTEWFKFCVDAKWSDPPGTETEPGSVAWLDDLGGCVSGWDLSENREGARGRRMKCVVRSMDRLFPVGEQSPEVIALLIRAVGRNPDPQYLLEAVCRRRLATDVVSRNEDNYLANHLQYSNVLKGSRDPVSKLVRRLVADKRPRGDDASLRDALLRMAMKIEDPELVLEVMTCEAGNSSKWDTSLMFLLKSGAVERADTALSGLPSRWWVLPVKKGEKRSDYMEARAILNLDDLEQRWLALGIDLIHDEGRPERRFNWWWELNENTPEDSVPARFYVDQLFHSYIWSAERSPLLERAFDEWRLTGPEHFSKKLDYERWVLNHFDLQVAVACSKAVGGDFSTLTELGEHWREMRKSIPDDWMEPVPALRPTGIAMPFWLMARQAQGKLSPEAVKSAKIWSELMLEDYKLWDERKEDGSGNDQVILKNARLVAESLDMLASGDWERSQDFRGLDLMSLQRLHLGFGKCWRDDRTPRDSFCFHSAGVAFTRMQLRFAEADLAAGAVEDLWTSVLISRNGEELGFVPVFLLRDAGLFESVPDELIGTVIEKHADLLGKEDAPWLRAWMKRSDGEGDSLGIRELLEKLEKPDGEEE